jgi:translation initiation factor 6 (eIF-6)
MKKTDKSLSAKEKLITSIWSTAVGMVALVGIFGRGNPVAIAVPPLAAAATTVFVLNAEEKRKQLPEQAEKIRQLESRLETLETIDTKDDYLLTDRY